MNMIEQVARSIERACLEMETGEAPPDIYRRVGRPEYEVMARAAVEALREPTEDMISRGAAEFTDGGGSGLDKQEVREVVSSILRAALK